MKRLAAVAGALLAVVVLAAAGGRGSGERSYRVDAIFPTASNMIPGQEVKIAGAIVGSIEEVSLTDDYRARIRLAIDERFAPFRADASCFIEPASLIGEKFLQCAPGTPKAPVLGGDPPTIPLERTRSPVDLDLVFGALDLPQRQRLSLLLGELGMGLVARGRDLNQAIRRANPALEQTRAVLRRLGEDRTRLQALIADTDTVLAQLAPKRVRLQSVIERAARVTETTAAGRDDLRRTVQGLPPLLREAQPALDDLAALTSSGTPLLRNLRLAAPDLDALLREIPALAGAARPAVAGLGRATREGRPVLRRARPVVEHLETFAKRARPTGRLLAVLLESLRERGVVENLQLFTYYGALATSRFDSVSHIFPAHVITGPCSEYATRPVAGCSAHFREPAPVAQAAPRQRSRAGARGRRPAPRRRTPRRQAPPQPAPEGMRAAAPSATTTPVPDVIDGDQLQQILDLLLQP